MTWLSLSFLKYTPKNNHRVGSKYDRYKIHMEVFGLWFVLYECVHVLKRACLLGRHARTVCCLLLAIALNSAALAARNGEFIEKTYDIAIPKTTLEEALELFVRQTGFQLLFKYELVEGLESGPVQGSYSVSEGLNRLLDGTGLSFRIVGQSTITLIKKQESGVSMTAKKQKDSFLGIAAALSSLFAANAAVGQPTDRVAIEEVIVTAQKRVENLQTVPVSVAAFNSEKLETFKIKGVQDIAAFTPGMIAAPQAESGAGLRLSIRGIPAAGATLGLDSRVAIYVDGVYIGKGAGAVFDAIDLERVEVLKGPQGTLYGRNAVSGAINLIAKKAEIGRFGVMASAGWGNYNSEEYRASVNIPVLDSLSFKLSGMSNQRDGWITNHGLGEDFMGYDRTGGRVDIAWEPSEIFRVDYAFEDLTAKSQPTYYQSVFGGTGGAFGALLKPPVSNHRREDVVTAIDVPEVKTEIQAHSLTANWDWSSEHSVKLIAAHRQLDSKRWGAYFTESMINPIVGFDRIFGRNAPETDVDDHEQLSLELNFSGLLGESLDYLAGLYYFEEETGGGESVYATSDVPALRSSISQARFDTTAMALFGQLTWTPELFDRRLHITGGLRVSKDKREADTRTYTQVVANPQPYIRVIGGAPSASLNDDETWNSVDPALILKYDLGEQSMLYASYSTAFRSGGFNDTATIMEAFKFDKEEIEALEVGFKSSFFEDRVRINGAYFNYQIDGLQQVVPHPTIPTILTIGNTEGESQGIELDIVAQLTAGLTASITYAYLDTKSDDVEVVFSSPQTLRVVVPNGSAGNPENSVAVNLDYVWPVAYGEFQFHLGYNHTDSFFITTNGAELDARDLFDARLSLAGIPVGKGTASVALWGQNLTDNEYHIDRIEFSKFGPVGLGYDVVAFGTPRTYGVELKYEF